MIDWALNVPAMTREVTRTDIKAAAERIRPYVRLTPVLDVTGLFSDDYALFVKLEHTQVTGSFKPRGAFSLLTEVHVQPSGVVAASGGNFGIAAAHASRRLGYAATVFVPSTSPAAKLDRIRDEGADVRLIDGYYDDALEASMDFARESGALVAHAYDQHAVMAGQGTVGLELERQVEGLDTVIVAVGGGGLIGGIASWMRSDGGVVAVEPESCNSFHASLAAGRQVEVDVSGVASSSLGARSIGDHPWSARHWIDQSVLVTDQDILRAQRTAWQELRLAVEPSAATTLAALQSGALTPEGGSVVAAVLSGANIDPGTLS